MITPALRRAAFLLLLALVTVAFFWIISPFFGAVFWAMVLALMFMPVHRRLCARLRGRDTLAALGTLLFCMVIVVVPMIFVVGAITSAWPVITVSPAWFSQRQSSRRICLSGRFSVTVTDAVMISPMPTGRLKRSD